MERRNESKAQPCDIPAEELQRMYDDANWHGRTTDEKGKVWFPLEILVQAHRQHLTLTVNFPA